MVNKERRENCEALCRIVYSRPSFTEREILEEYKIARGGRTMVDCRHTVGGYLRVLNELGALSYSGGRYEVIGYPKSELKLAA